MQHPLRRVLSTASTKLWRRAFGASLVRSHGKFGTFRKRLRHIHCQQWLLGNLEILVEKTGGRVTAKIIEIFQIDIYILKKGWYYSKINLTAL